MAKYKFIIHSQNPFHAELSQDGLKYEVLFVKIKKNVYKSLGTICVYIHNGRSNLPGSFDSGGTGLFWMVGKKDVYFIIIKSNQLILIEKRN